MKKEKVKIVVVTEKRKGILRYLIDFRCQKESISLHFNHSAFGFLVFDGIEVRVF